MGAVVGWEPRLRYTKLKARQAEITTLSIGIVKLRLTAVSDAQHGGFTTGSVAVSRESVS